MSAQGTTGEVIELGVNVVDLTDGMENPGNYKIDARSMTKRQANDLIVMLRRLANAYGNEAVNFVTGGGLVFCEVRERAA